MKIEEFMVEVERQIQSIHQKEASGEN